MGLHGALTFVALAVFAGEKIEAPDFTLKDAWGKEVALSDFRGRLVLVDFWATWCGPCRESMPHIERLHKKYGRRGFQVLAVNVEQQEAVARDYLRRGGYTFTVLFDSEGEVASRYRISGIPRSFLVDRDGNLVYAGHPLGLSEALIERALVDRSDAR